MLHEKGISRSWIESAVFQPDKIEEHADGTRHFLKKIDEFGGIWLRVVVNAASVPENTSQPFLIDGQGGSNAGQSR